MNRNFYYCENPDLAAEKFTNKLTQILDVMAPVKTVQIRNNYAPWLSPDLRTKMKARDKAQEKSAKSGKDEDWTEYKRLRNQINNHLKTQKEVWQRQKLVEYSDDSGSTWKNIRTWLGWTTGGPPTKLMENGRLENKPQSLARIMNQFFIEKVHRLRNNLPPSATNPLLLPSNLMQARNCSFSVKPVHPNQVLKIISNLKSSKSCGLDNIDTYILKLGKESLTPAITHIVNLSLSYRVFPKKWKSAKVIPLHKKDDVTNPKNYRPVSLLSVTSKILERAVFLQLIEFLEENNLLHPYHHGFRSKHNTSTALLQMYDVWLEALENNEVSAVVMLDMSAAFDVVDHPILLDKLKIYGIDEDGITWFKSYLSDRSQQVYIDGVLSEPLNLEAGVPQGSVLGPLLYILFTNDLPEVIHNHHSDNQTYFNQECQDCGSICCFADDSTYTISSKNTEVINITIDEKFKQIKNYMASNKLVLNNDKTHLLVLATPAQHRQNQDFGIFLDTGDELINPIKSEKLLGGFITNDFTFNEHLKDNEKSVFRSLTSRVNALAKVSKIASFRTRKMIADGVLISKILYLIQWWGGTHKYLINFPQKLQIRAAHLVTKLGWRTPPTAVLLAQCGWLSVNQMVHFHSLTLVYKIKLDKKPEYFGKSLKPIFPMMD